MFGSILVRIINLWLWITGRVVYYKNAMWLKGPMSDANVVGAQFYNTYAEKEHLGVKNATNGGLLENFDSLISENDIYKDKVSIKVKHFYEHTSQYKLEVWSQWYSPIRFFAKILIRTVSTKMNQLNIPIEPLETSMGMTNEVLQLYNPNTNKIICACWLRKLVLSSRVVYAGFYSSCIVNEQPYVKVVFPLPKGNVTVLLQVIAQNDGSVKLLSHGKRMNEAGYYRVAKRDQDSVKVRCIPLTECIHVYEDAEGILRTNHEFSFWGIKFLHLHYKILAV